MCVIFSITNRALWGEQQNDIQKCTAAVTEPRKLVVFPKGLVETSDVCLLNWAESGGSQQPYQFPDLEAESEVVLFFSFVLSAAGVSMAAELVEVEFLHL